MHGQEAEDPGTHLRMLGDARSEHGTSRTARRGFLVALGALSLAVVPGSSAFSVSLVGGWGATQQRVHALMPRCGGQPWGRKISSRKSFPCLALLLVQLRDAVRASLERTKLCTCRAVRAGDATAMELCPCALDPGQRRHFVAAQCASIPYVCMAGAAGSSFREDGWQDRRGRWESKREGEPDAWGTPRVHTCLLQETGCETVNKWVSGKRGERARELEGPTLVLTAAEPNLLFADHYLLEHDQAPTSSSSR